MERSVKAAAQRPPLPAAREAREFFTRTFGSPPTHTVTAPGRLELLGNHTDYNQGLVLSLAIDRATALSVAPRLDGRIELVSTAFPGRVTFPLDVIARDPACPWANYPKGVLLQLQRRGVHFTGFNAAVHSTLPIGGGLSSSAAFEIVTALAVRAMHPYSLTSTGCTVPPRRAADGTLPPTTNAEKLETAKLCIAAESEFVGLNCGLLDPISSLFGKSDHAIEIDFQSLAIEPVPMSGEIAIVVCPSGVQHELVAGAYNELRRHCDAAAAALGARSLRPVDSQRLAANKSRLTHRQHECASHVIGEIQRVVFGARALRDGDLEQFGQYLYQSHESSRDVFGNSCAELDLLVDLARRHPACVGARLTGGGFGGSTINLVHRSGAESFMREIAEGYERAISIPIQPLVCQPADGAR
jgi:galactokinase